MWLLSMVLPPRPVWHNILASHPEHAELRRRDRGVEGGGDAKPQGHAGIGGIDNPIVPQPGAGVIGMALVLVLVADRRLEGFFILGTPALALSFHAVAAH